MLTVRKKQYKKSTSVSSGSVWAGKTSLCDRPSHMAAQPWWSLKLS